MHTPHPSRAILPRLVLILALVGISGLPAEAQSAPPPPPAPAPAAPALAGAPEYAPGVVLVGLRPDADGGAFAPAALTGGVWDALHAAGKPEAVFPWARRAGHALSPDAAGALGRVFRYRVPEGLSVEDIVEILSVDPAVAYAEPDYLARPALSPNDPDVGEQWALGAIGAPAAWDVTTGSDAVAIAVVDSGIDLAHEDLAGQLWTNPGETPANGVDDDGNGLVDDVHGWNLIAHTGEIVDRRGHGTQVAGVLGAAGNNGRGIAGMCWGCRIVVAQAMQESGTANYSDIAEAVAYAAGMGAGVINVSLGGYADSQTLRTAIQSAAATAVVVAGAGNDGLATPFYPAAYPEAIAVASVGAGDALAASSNRGAWVDIAAPGEGIRTTLAGGGYGEASGTSLATALVAGTAGLVRSAHPEWSPALVRQHLLLTAADVSDQNPDQAGMLGSGRLDAAAALSQAPQPRVAVSGWTVDGEVEARPTPGTAFTLALTIANEWLPGRGLVGMLTESDTYATVTDATGTFGDLNTGQTRDNAGDTFGVTLAAGTPYSHPIPFTLRLTGADGYAVSVPFTLTVRGSTETLPDGAMVETDTVWSGDKVYVLTGNASVAPGVTLTIEPGATIKVAPDKWLRIDGTLIAEGTEEAPITFTTTGPSVDVTMGTGEPWAGLRFSETATGALFDAEGRYLSGSILRHVHLLDATIGVRSTGQAPYLHRSAIERCHTGAEATSGDMRIEDTTFERNGSGIVGGFAYSSMTVLGCDLRYHSNVGLQAIGRRAHIERNHIAFNAMGMWVGHDLEPTDALISGNLIALNAGTGVVLGSGRMAHNTVVSNGEDGIGINSGDTSTITIEYNNLFANGTYDLSLNGAAYMTMTLGANYWGDIPASSIASRIYDCNDTETGCAAGSTLGRVTRAGDLTDPDPDAPAFVRSVTVSPETVGIETGAVEVKFSRPMLQEVPPTLSFHDSRRGSQEAHGLMGGSHAADVIANGDAWVPSGSQLDQYDGTKWTSHVAPEGFPSRGYLSLTRVTDDGRCVWTADTWGVVARLCGSEWTVYNDIWPQELLEAIPMNVVTSIIEDEVGGIWVNSYAALAHYDGAGWHVIVSLAEGGGINGGVSAEDEGGRMWALTGGALYLLDGGVWTAVPEILGVPTANAAALFRDRSSRLWLAPGSGSGAPTRPVLVYADGEWRGYSAEEIGLSSGGIWGFSDGPHGTVIARGTDSGWFSFAEGRWLPAAYAFSPVASMGGPGWFEFDMAGNAWWLDGADIRVLWGGLDYSAETGADWLSPTTYRATFDVTPAIPRGTYVLSVEGGVGTDGILAAPAPPVTFTIDYAGGVTDSTAPPRPSVRAYGDGSLSTIDVQWSAADPDSAIDEFRYALGTTPGGRDAVDWTYLPGSASSARLTGLLLTRGQAYYATVAARNASGLWSANGISNAVLGGEVTPEVRLVTIPLVQR